MVDRRNNGLTVNRLLLIFSMKRLKGDLSGVEPEQIVESQGLVEPKTSPDTDLVIEAVFEDFDIKTAVFATLDEVRQHTILASNTSSLSVNALAEATGRPILRWSTFLLSSAKNRLSKLSQQRLPPKQSLDAVEQYCKTMGGS